MIEQLNLFAKEKKLFTKKNKILLAISGGIDSVVMLDLMVNAGYKCGIAHCNFKLRAEESDGDEVFVYELSRKYNVEFFSTLFETENYSAEMGISIQMAARDLRYSWFEKMRKENNYDYIAIAHNINDTIETFMINMSRGTGLPGLTGIKAKKGNILRPLLFASRSEIKAYADGKKLTFREDSSNESIKYLRNKIRHKVIPVFKEINPVFETTMIENIRRLDETADIFFQKVNEIKNKLISEKGEFIYIDIQKLKQLGSINTYLYEFLRPYGFAREILPKIIHSIDSTPGKQFYSKDYRLIKDRNKLIIYPARSEPKGQIFINESLMSFTEPINLEFKLIKRSSKYKINPDKFTACIDYDMLKFPIILRKWRFGDQFMPLGMKSMKKLSDFFIDNKISIPEKENTWILSSNDNIIWVIGKRLDERYKIRKHTETILEITYS